MNILIATDGSEYSKIAIKECCRLFPNLANTKLKIVSAYEEEYALAAEPFAVAAEYYQQMADAAKSSVHHSAESAAGLIRAEMPGRNLDIQINTLKGSPHKEIVEAAK